MYRMSSSGTTSSASSSDEHEVANGPTTSKDWIPTAAAAANGDGNGDDSSVTPRAAAAAHDSSTPSIRQQVDESIHLDNDSTTEQGPQQLEQNDNNNSDNDGSMSIPNLLGTTLTPPLFNLLRLLATASLSTTGKVLAPPLHLTRTVLFPTIYGTVTDQLNALTPTRVKDWFSIFRKGIQHLWGVIISSPTGQTFRGQVYTVGGDLVDVAATPTARQVVVDFCATIIKIAEALHTPEFRTLLHHVSVLGCRVVDAASTGPAKKLMHDISDSLWSFVELLADERTTVAVAEVTAYLCHALEMEHSLYRDPHHPPPPPPHHDDGGDDGRSEFQNQQRERAARRRRERGRQNARTYGPDCDTIGGGGDGGDAVRGPNGLLDESAVSGGVGIEEAILSSLGDADRIYGKNDEGGEDVGAAAASSNHNYGGGGAADLDETATDLSFDPAGTAASSLPSRVVVDDGLGNGLDPPSTDVRGKQRTVEVDDASSINTDRTEGINIGGNDDGEGKAFADDACDVEFLRKQIARRARTIELEQKRNRRRVRGGQQSLVDIEDTALSAVQTAGEATPASTPARIKPPSNVNQFYRRVEQVSTQRQAEVIDNFLREQDGGGEESRHWYSRAAAAAGAGNEHGQDTMKSRLEAYVSKASRARGDIGVGLGRSSKAANAQIPVRSRLLVWIFVLWFLLGCAVMGGFSCYGIYVYFFASRSVPPTGTVSAHSSFKTKVFGWMGATPQAAPAPNEIVIKIVREVVHVAPDGSRYTLPSENDSSNADTQAVEAKIAEAATSAIQQAVRAHAEL